MRWTPLDRAKAEEYAAWKAAACPGCGTREDEWDPKRGGHRFAFVASTHRCPGCELKEMERDQIPENTKGIKIGLIPNPELLNTDEQVA